jgi:tRNA A37 threonylcarbamoyladenosine synthetase subunit TsaC/SUA5/YrdC
VFEGHKVDLMIDSGFIGNTPSTVIDLRGQNPMLIRKGKGKIF